MQMYLILHPSLGVYGQEMKQPPTPTLQCDVGFTKMNLMQEIQVEELEPRSVFLHTPPDL